MAKILFVDNDLTLLSLYEEELSEEGYSVFLAKDGEEALTKFKKESPDVVVMDIRMPVMDGIETLTTMLGKERRVSVLLNTAYPQYRQNFMTWGDEAYVLKSSDLTDLEEKIRETLDKRKKRIGFPPGAKKISAKCSTAMVSWGANCSSPRLLKITCGDLLPSPLPLSPTGRGKGEGDLWRYFLQRLGKVLMLS